MMNELFDEARINLAALVVFRGILKDPVVAAFSELVESRDLSPLDRIKRYSAFASKLLEEGGNWSEHLLIRILRDENPLVRSIAENREPSPSMIKMAEYELSALQQIGRITSACATAFTGSPIPLAEWTTSELDYKSRYRDFTSRINELGYGIFADYSMFFLDGGEIVPVKNPDASSFDTLSGYESERRQIAANTVALVEGRPAANALLYGDSGTGKSTCVKAVVNKLKHRGLRLIEVRKNQLDALPSLIDRLHKNPLKFILFIDDLSFSQESDNYAALKGILEGSVAARANNTLIYATSNRRHFIRERFSQRDGDDIHINDTMEELTSLSDRFGLTVTFQRPDKELYLEIVRHYLKTYKIKLEDYLMSVKAEEFALRKGGRSARAARQFVESLASQNVKETTV